MATHPLSLTVWSTARTRPAPFVFRFEHVHWAHWILQKLDSVIRELHWTPERLQQETTSTWSNNQGRRNQLLQAQWTKEDDELLEELKQAILDNPVLKRPVPKRIFYLKTDWSCNAQGAVLLQAGWTEKEEAALNRELEGGACKFEMTMGGLQLRPIAFTEMTATPSCHLFVGKASTAGHWAMLKFKIFLIGQEFTWIIDCSS